MNHSNAAEIRRLVNNSWDQPVVTVEQAKEWVLAKEIARIRAAAVASFDKEFLGG
jgi:hypothetical protein